MMPQKSIGEMPKFFHSKSADCRKRGNEDENWGKYLEIK
jgi:hypothetical protein